MFFVALLALATAQSDSTIVPSGQWNIDYGRLSCTLARRLGEGGSPILALNAPLGLEPGEFLLLDGGDGLDSRLTGQLELRLDDGAPLIVRTSRERRNGSLIVKFRPMPDNFLDRIAGARRLTVSRDGAEILAVALPHARAAADELTRCNDDLMRSWGIDVEARRALGRQPSLGGAEWAFQISPSTDISLVFAATLTEQGRPLDCRVVVSSGNARLDDAFCDVVRSRARFVPALNAEGRPVPSQYVTRIRWLT